MKRKECNRLIEELYSYKNSLEDLQESVGNYCSFSDELHREATVTLENVLLQMRKYIREIERKHS